MPIGASALAVFTLEMSTEVSDNHQPPPLYAYNPTHWLQLMVSILCFPLGGPGEAEKEGSVMVEFDDGDRGRISLANIRLLPPGYQIRCKYGFVERVMGGVNGAY